MAQGTEQTQSDVIIPLDLWPNGLKLTVIVDAAYSRDHPCSGHMHESREDVSQITANNREDGGKTLYNYINHNLVIW